MLKRTIFSIATVGLLFTAGIAYATVPTFSQTSITVGSGQSTTITSTNGASLYLESNSSPTNVSVSTNGTQATFIGLAPGGSSVVLCNVGTASDCATLGVSVQSGNVTGILFSQTNPSLLIGSTQSITVSGGNGTYSISSNSNASVVSTNLSGNLLTVSGVALGGATITVCDTSNTCGTLSVTINSSSSSSSGLTFGQNNLSLVTGGSQIVSISGGNGSYSISSNSNSAVVSAGMSGSNSISLYASSPGSATITVCDSSNTCASLYAMVSASTATSGGVVFGVTNPTLTVGQTLNVGLSGGASTYVILSNSNGNIVQASVTNSSLSLYGENAGADSLTICATGGGCSAFSVTVSGSTTAPTTVTSPTTVTTPTGTVVPNATLLSEIQTLQTALSQALTQIQSMETDLAQIEAQVNAGSGSTVSTSASSASGYQFTELLTVGSEDAQVTALQEKLSSLGFYSGPVTGFYGSLTEAAVMKYQTAHGIDATGYVGPSTRAALNAG